jgi:hypothetical protein
MSSNTERREAFVTQLHQPSDYEGVQLQSKDSPELTLDKFSRMSQKSNSHSANNGKKLSIQYYFILLHRIKSEFCSQTRRIKQNSVKCSSQQVNSI